MTTTTATPKQIAYALALLKRAGYPTDWMSAAHKPLATMRERSGRVEDWLSRMSKTDISALIGKLA